MSYLGIEIGGTKLQIGVGPADGRLRGLWRGIIDVQAGPEGIRRQIQSAIRELLNREKIPPSDLQAAAFGFGGPIDDHTRTVIKSHQVAGWESSPLADWLQNLLGLPAALGNDADVAALAEATYGAGKGLTPIFYMTIGSGIGGGLVHQGEIYRGCGRGAVEVGHLLIGPAPAATLEGLASGWAIEQRARQLAADNPASHQKILELAGGQADRITTRLLGEAALRSDAAAQKLLDEAIAHYAEALVQVITLLCPRRIVIGGGVSLLGERLLFEPLRKRVEKLVFPPFAGLTDIVPASLGEEVVVHGAICLAHKHWVSRERQRPEEIAASSAPSSGR
jgi:glucokinase